MAFIEFNQVSHWKKRLATFVPKVWNMWKDHIESFENLQSFERASEYWN